MCKAVAMSVRVESYTSMEVQDVIQFLHAWGKKYRPNSQRTCYCLSEAHDE